MQAQQQQQNHLIGTIKNIYYNVSKSDPFYLFQVFCINIRNDFGLENSYQLCDVHLYFDHIHYMRNYPIDKFIKNSTGYYIYSNDYHNGKEPMVSINLYETETRICIMGHYDFFNINETHSINVRSIVQNAYNQYYANNNVLLNDVFANNFQQTIVA